MFAQWRPEARGAAVPHLRRRRRWLGLDGPRQQGWACVMPTSSASFCFSFHASSIIHERLRGLFVLFLAFRDCYVRLPPVWRAVGSEDGQTHPPTHTHIPEDVRSMHTCLHTCILTCTLTCSLTCSLTHSLAHSLAHSHTHTLAHSHTVAHDPPITSAS